MHVKISVIVPVYNVEQYLNACIESVINQTLPFYEIILVDDGSKDTSGKLCDSWVKKDSRIKVIHQENGGLSAARNTGINVATGDYLLFVDSDDSIDTDTVERFVVTLDGRKPDLLVANLRVISGNKIKHKPHTIQNSCEFLSGTEYLKYEYAHHTMHMAAVQCLYRRNFLLENDLLFKPGLLHEDELFTPVTFSKAQIVIPTAIEFYNHMMREGSITTSKIKTKNAESIVEICYLLEEFTDELTDHGLKKRILEHCVDLYYKIFIDADLINYKDIRLENRYLQAHSHELKNLYRTAVYATSPKLFSFLEGKRRNR